MDREAEAIVEHNLYHNTHHMEVGDFFQANALCTLLGCMGAEVGDHGDRNSHLQVDHSDRDPVVSVDDIGEDHVHPESKNGVSRAKASQIQTHIRDAVHDRAFEFATVEFLHSGFEVGACLKLNKADGLA